MQICKKCMGKSWHLFANWIVSKCVLVLLNKKVWIHSSLQIFKIFPVGIQIHIIKVYKI